MSVETESPPLPCVLLEMRDMCLALKVSKPVVYALINAGTLQTFLIGNRRFTTPKLLQDCVDALAQAGKTPLPSERPNNRHRPVVQKTKRAASARGARG